MKAIGASLVVIAMALWLIGGNVIYFRACQRRKVSPWPVSVATFRSMTRRDWIQVFVLGGIVLVSASFGGKLMG